MVPAAAPPATRISTNRRAWEHPLDPQTAADLVADWLDAGPVWTPEPEPRYAEILLGYSPSTRSGAAWYLVSDAQLAAPAIEHGLTVYFADTDFARFTELNWANPISPDNR